MGRHLLIAMAYATAITGYGWRDSRYLVRRKTRQDAGEPKRHRAKKRQPAIPQTSLVRILEPAAEDHEDDPADFARPEEDVRKHYPVGPWPPGPDLIPPEDASADTMPGQPRPAFDPAHTMTMTQPIDRGEQADGRTAELHHDDRR